MHRNVFIAFMSTKRWCPELTALDIDNVSETECRKILFWDRGKNLEANAKQPLDTLKTIHVRESCSYFCINKKKIYIYIYINIYIYRPYIHDIYIYIYIYTCRIVYINLYIYIYKFECGFVYIRARACVRMCACACLYVSVCVRVCVCMCISVYMRVCVRIGTFANE